jgi:hypothetical protein
MVLGFPGQLDLGARILRDRGPPPSSLAGVGG